MNNLFNIFSTREIALIVWFLVFLISVSRTKKVRQSIIRVVKAFFNKKLILAFSTLLLYMLLIIFLLSHFGFWNISLLKDTCIWILFSGIVLFINISKIKDINYFAQLIKAHTKIVIIWEFVFNFYTLTLTGELIFVPVVSLFSILQVFAENLSKEKEKDKEAILLCKNVLGLIGLGAIGYVIYKTITEYELLFSYTNLKSFILPILLVILALPYFYFLAIFTRYENIFTRINIFLKFRGKEQIKIAKKQILISANISLTKLYRVDRNFLSLKSSKDIREQIKRITKKPLYKKGIIGTIAKIRLFNDVEECIKLLSNIGIGKLSEWRNIGTAFESITPYYELSNSYKDSYVGLSNNIACYLSGEETYIKQLNITLNINNIKQKDSALSLLKECITKISIIFNIEISHDIIASVDSEKEINFLTEMFLCKLSIYQYKNMDVWEFIVETIEN